MVKVTVDIGDNYWLAKPLTAIEKLATEEQTNIDDVAGIVHAAQDAAVKCNPHIPAMDDEDIYQNTTANIERLRDRVGHLEGRSHL